MYYLRTVFLFSFTLLCTTCIDAVCAVPAQKDPEYDGFDLASYTYDIGAWLGGQSITPSHQEEGEAHSKLSIPDGAEFITLPASDEGDETIPVFRTQRDDFSKMKLQHAFIVMHGKLRDGGHYWQMMDKAVSKAQDDHKIGDSIVVAPQFFSKKYNKGQYSDDDLAWADRNAWQSGSRAIHPDNTTLSSIDAIDAVIEHYSNLDLYPSMKNVTVIGHGGGGQLIQRYAVVARDVPKHLHLRFIHGDPSSCVYFTDHRTLPAKKEKSRCKYYNTWRYGFDHFPGTLKEHKTPRQYFEQYISRDVISIVGYQDVSATGDESCMAKLQGGSKRRDRNLIWYRYVNTLARTTKDLRGFPGKFAHLPDWSDSSNGTFRLRLVVVQDVAHNMEDLLQTKSGKSALFDNGDIDTGWSPT